MEEVKKPLTALTAKFQELRAFHEDADQKLANFTTNLEAYEQLHSSLQNNLVAKQSQLNVVIGDRQSMTIDAELLGQDVDKMGALGKELTELDADICCINKLSNLLLENAKDSVTLGNQIAKVNEQLILNNKCTNLQNPARLMIIRQETIMFKEKKISGNLLSQIVSLVWSISFKAYK